MLSIKVEQGRGKKQEEGQPAKRLDSGNFLKSRIKGMCCFDVACERREESKMTKLSRLSNWRMELSVIQTGTSKEGTGLGVDQEFPWGYVELDILSNNQRRHQVSCCVYDSGVQGRILGEYMNVGVTGPRVR